MANIGLPDDFSISAPLFDSVGIAPYGPTVQNWDTSKGEQIDNDVNHLKELGQINEMRINEHDRRIYDIEEKVKEALLIMKHPGIIANRVLDKMSEFIASKKTKISDGQGLEVDIVTVHDLNNAIEKLREVIKNGNNNEGL